MLINNNQLKLLWEKCLISKVQYELIQWEDNPGAREELMLYLYDYKFDSYFYDLHFELVPMVKHNNSADYKLWQQRGVINLMKKDIYVIYYEHVINAKDHICLFVDKLKKDFVRN